MLGAQNSSVCTPAHRFPSADVRNRTYCANTCRYNLPMVATAHLLQQNPVSTVWPGMPEDSRLRTKGALIEVKQSTTDNRLLAALTDRSRQAFLAHCDHVALNAGEVLCRAGDEIRHVYFPLNCCLFQMTALDTGERLEVGLVGDEGMLGVPLILGVDVSSQLARVQGAGTALRMSAAQFRRHSRESLSLRQEIHRYAHVLMSQLARAITCTHYHVVEARLARWLLMTRDRMHANQFRLTHELMAELLGVRRAGVTRAASSLRERKLIRYTRGNITIVDEQGLEAAACGCYLADRVTYSGALGSRP
jgi:CRP-like cAMP-binding protein